MRTRWWAATAVVALVAVGGGAAVWSATPRHAPVPAALHDALTARVVRHLEADPAWATESTMEPGYQPVCEGDVFGLDPVDARDVGQVRSVYAWVFCKWLPPAEHRAGRTAQELPAEVVPIAVRLGQPDRFEVPRDGEGVYPADIRRIFPRDVRDVAFGGFPGLDAATTRLDARVTALLA
ncbi:hypothetical protein ODJ79_32850 [Actinoplanes sp. KI2]|uniref:hypothetical protein n=1 Tax=Actinoplanes sp. KI2 TaxID=2983315 RepID=UPI0021D57C96|nr:hypothetical protein [Actinoplanes sp. KI2]MCU7728526.1 hypothetical protein [Actinoplanes sp. KI2]